jgi:ABC-type Fe3+/spermidine/putrescine transport system ATPase subunit
MRGDGLTPSIRLVDLAKTFGSVRAVDGVDLEIGDGEFFSMLGPSGSGKTTVLRMIADLQQPSEGTITRTDAVSTRGGTSMVFQRPALLPWRTVLDNVLAPMEVLG